LRPQKKGAGWLLNRRKATAVSSPQLQEPSSPVDKGKATTASPNNFPLITAGKSKLLLEEFRRKRTVSRLSVSPQLPLFNFISFDYP
uniref:TPX2_importin domain-containing protein n=1 Tax=Hydatigena taeniaeformis TaxID=6205 RepID=A0A0R3WYK8_HYDTA